MKVETSKLVEFAYQIIADEFAREASGTIHDVAKDELSDLPREFGRYQLGDEIARGGVGAIFRGRDLELGREIAIKVLLSSRQKEAVQRLANEAKIGGQLQHPGIAPVYDVGLIDGSRPFFAMKLVLGETLANVLRQHSDSSADQNRLLNDFQQVCQTMAYAHSRGVIHRDLKPANIMIGKFGEVQVMDWGLAKVLDSDSDQSSETKAGVMFPTTGAKLPENTEARPTLGGVDALTEAGSVMGTLAYMAPEQAQGRVDQLDRRTDVFALGAILCQIISRHPPYLEKSRQRALRVASAGQLEECFARLEACSADAALVQLAKDCLAVDPDDRPSDAGVVADRITDHMESVQTRMRQAELREAQQIVRTQQAEQLADAAQAQTQSERRARRLQLAMATVVLTSFIIGFVLIAFYVNAQKENNERISNALETNLDNLYVAHTQTAQQAWKSGSMRRLRELLDMHRPTAESRDGIKSGTTDRRTFEWYYLDSICAEVESRPIMDYGHIVAKLSASAEGNLVAATGNRGNIQVFDLASHQRLCHLSAHPEVITRLQVTPSGDAIISMDKQRFRVWRRNGDTYDKWHEGPCTNPRSAHLSFDGKRLLTEVSGNVVVWDLEDSEPKAKELSLAAAPRDLAWFHDHRHFLVLASDNTVWVGDADRQTLSALTVSINYPMKRIAINDDDSHVVIVGDEETQVFRQHGFEKLTGTSVSNHQGERLHDVLCLPSLYLVLTTENVSARAYDGTLLQRLPASELNGVPRRCCRTPSGDLFAFFAEGNVVDVYDGNTAKHVTSIKGHENVVYAAGMNRHGQVITGSRDRTVRVADTTSRMRPLTLSGHDGWVWAVRFSPDGKTLASCSADHRVILWNAVTGDEIARLTEHTGSVQSVAFSPDGMLLASCGRDHAVRLWDVSSRQSIGEFRGHAAGVNSIDFSPDGARLVSGSDDGVVIVWDVASRKPIKEYRLPNIFPRDEPSVPGQVWAVAFTKSDEVLFGGTDDILHAWDLSGSSPTPIHTTTADITSVQWSPTSGEICCTTADGNIDILDASQKLSASLKAHAADAMFASFSPDAKTLVSSASDGMLQFWSTTVREPTLAIQSHDAHVHCAVFSPSGTSVATASWDHTCKIWFARRMQGDEFDD